MIVYLFKEKIYENIFNFLIFEKYLYFDWIINVNEFNDCLEEFDVCGLCLWIY